MSNATTTSDLLACLAISIALFGVVFGPFCLLMHRMEKDTDIGGRPDAGKSTPAVTRSPRHAAVAGAAVRRRARGGRRRGLPGQAHPIRDARRRLKPVRGVLNQDGRNP